MKSRVFIGILLALLVIVAGASTIWLLKSPFAYLQQAPVTHITPYVVHRTQEVPLAIHRRESMVAAQMTTSTIPWGIALDTMHGYVWVASRDRTDPQVSSSLARHSWSVCLLRRQFYRRLQRANWLFKPALCSSRQS